mmetsp:Transcript_35705/g.57367  ORF Transcript_35705/g.57367 Transcript_35705/m.57367 type:complete len:184 (+) Transcript_35705:179-730(+)
MPNLHIPVIQQPAPNLASRARAKRCLRILLPMPTQFIHPQMLNLSQYIQRILATRYQPVFKPLAKRNLHIRRIQQQYKAQGKRRLPIQRPTHNLCIPATLQPASNLALPALAKPRKHNLYIQCIHREMCNLRILEIPLLALNLVFRAQPNLNLRILDILRRFMVYQVFRARARLRELIMLDEH